ncbi:hypothetical protein PLICRDRAFT_174559 [Plicaturopsis crispa FD-325 SS-3]|nr:hypothetical protein PLICRDRAFT_174559 [Plicaturopsis crispa FD-325 SS-3]
MYPEFLAPNLHPSSRFPVPVVPRLRRATWPTESEEEGHDAHKFVQKPHSASGWNNERRSKPQRQTAHRAVEWNPINWGGRLEVPSHMPLPASPTPISPRSHFPSSPSQPRRRIYFYHKRNPYNGFSNFSLHPVTYKGRDYPTSEHLFQSMKFHGHFPQIAELVRTCSLKPRKALECAHEHSRYMRCDWSRVNLQKMEEVLMFKFIQHPILRKELLATGDAELIDDSAQDPFWGIGKNGEGRNELGKALERVRVRLGGL